MQHQIDLLKKQHPSLEVVVHPTCVLSNFEACIKDITCPHAQDKYFREVHQMNCQCKSLHDWMVCEHDETQVIAPHKRRRKLLQGEEDEEDADDEEKEKLLRHKSNKVQLMMIETSRGKYWMLYSRNQIQWKCWVPSLPTSLTSTPLWLSTLSDYVCKRHMVFEHVQWVPFKVDLSDTEFKWACLFLVCIHGLNKDPKDRWMDLETATAKALVASKLECEPSLKWVTVHKTHSIKGQPIPIEDLVHLNRQSLTKFQQWISRTTQVFLKAPVK
jgi:hypothetical protein